MTIFFFTENFELKEKIFSETADIRNNNWSLKNGSIIKFDDKVELKKFDTFEFLKIYGFLKIEHLLKAWK